MNSGFWTKNEQKIYNKYICHIINKHLTFQDLSLIMKTRNRTQIRSHHQKSMNYIKKISRILLELKNNQ